MADRRPPASSPAFRLALIRRLRNLLPDCSVEIIEDDKPGIAFRVKDSRGRDRTEIIRINRNLPHTLDRSNLTNLIASGRVPPAGRPRGLKRQ